METLRCKCGSELIMDSNKPTLTCAKCDFKYDIKIVMKSTADNSNEIGESLKKIGNAENQITYNPDNNQFQYKLGDAYTANISRGGVGCSSIINLYSHITGHWTILDRIQLEELISFMDKITYWKM